MSKQPAVCLRIDTQSDLVGHWSEENWDLDNNLTAPNLENYLDINCRGGGKQTRVVPD